MHAKWYFFRFRVLNALKKSIGKEPTWKQSSIRKAGLEQLFQSVDILVCTHPVFSWFSLWSWGAGLDPFKKENLQKGSVSITIFLTSIKIENDNMNMYPCACDFHVCCTFNVSFLLCNVSNWSWLSILNKITKLRFLMLMLLLLLSMLFLELTLLLFDSA